MSPPISTSHHQAKDAFRPTWNAVLEVAGLWWLTLGAGLLLVTASLLQIHSLEADNIRHSSVSLALTELRESIETDIALGLELSENRSIQSHLEASLTTDTNLHAIDVVSKAGTVLFSTDRGAIGEVWQQDVARPAEENATRQHQWAPQAGGEAVTSQILRNAFGEVVGHISATYAAPPSRFSSAAIRAGMPLWLATATIFLALSACAWLAARWALRPHYRYLHIEHHGAMAQAMHEAGAVRQRMEDCLVRLDEGERPE